jgi:hypothetical protein
LVVPSPIATRDIDEPRRRAPSPPPREEEDEFISEEEDDFIVDDDDGVEEPGEELRPIRRKRRQEETGGITTEQLRTAEAMYNFDEYLAPAPGERRYADDDDVRFLVPKTNILFVYGLTWIVAVWYGRL